MLQAIGVFVQPAKTATNPVAASNAMGSGIMLARALPSVAPIKNNGVTSPPLKPALSVIAVNKIFKRKSVGGRAVSKEDRMVGIPKPMYLLLCRQNTITIISSPPINGRNKGWGIFWKSELNSSLVKMNRRAARPNAIPANRIYPSSGIEREGVVPMGG
ncbi:hypothetical protein GCM10017764_13200 [Sphingobacterium griseoflavum]|uniref:Uncharacterized protein n=1 Tax=Sphingobacterium griseoflavum TaxID=1474952 RepID=A0ABQ3HVZ9_9SPHI|nr:hypothetical protein GCM10017764_13200 [Sphingobacterium griseoflavum]